MRLRKKVILVGLLGIFILAVCLAYLRVPALRALLKSKRHFVVHATESRVLYEPGAEVFADKIAGFLPMAVDQVAEGHSLPFKKPFKIYVFATQKSHNDHLAIPASLPIRGAAFSRKVYISPSAFSFEGLDTHRESLKHEMSHLLMRQYLGIFKRRKIPVWFSEGLANIVADSGGEGITEGQMIEAVKQGRQMPIEEEGGLLKSPSTILKGTGLSGPMYHKQNRMFVGFIRDTDPVAFNRLIAEVFGGRSFPDAFQELYSATPEELWAGFINRF
jgi:hypothetical protein